MQTILNIDSVSLGERPVDTYFGKIIEDGQFKHFFDQDLVGIKKLPDFFKSENFIMSDRYSDGLHFLYPFDNGVIKLNHYAGNKLTIIGCFLTYEECQKASNDIKKLFPKELLIDTSIPIEFWNFDGKKGSRTLRTLEDMPRWNDISINYEKSVKNELHKLMKLKEIPSGSGKLLLWRGTPGTGKTFAIRALINQWKDWCDAHYIVDPEIFFSTPTYMMNVLLRMANMDEREFDDPRNTKNKWNMLILEDAGELIVSDARARSDTGHALSKLLNIGDGLLGQGIKLLILITTNEDDEKLEKAVSREGRCLSKLKFNEFSTEEAIEWFRLKNADFKNLEVDKNKRNLSDLYAQLNNSKMIKNEESEKRMGFR